MKFKGTKGEWKAVELNEKMAACTHEIQFNTDGECITDGVYGEANAQLIAAAPNLLEALQDITTYFGYMDEESKQVVNAKKAINKAIGK